MCPTALVIAELSKAILEALAAPQHAEQADATVRRPALTVDITGAGYRMLEIGETIQPGDEMLDITTALWVKRDVDAFFIGKSVTAFSRHYFRRATTPAPATTFTPVGGPIIFMLPEESKKDRALATMHAALVRINRWQFPVTLPVPDHDGQRRFMRQVALDALLATMDSTDPASAPTQGKTRA